MASSTYPLSQEATFTLPGSVDNLHLDRLRARRQENLRDVTGTSGGSTDSSPVFIHGLPTKEIEGSGYVRQSSDSTYGDSGSSSYTAAMNIVPLNYAVRKRWELADVTSGGPKEWLGRRPIVSVNVLGFIKSTYNEFDTNSISVNLSMDKVGTLTGTGKFDSKTIEVLNRRGGHVPIEFGFVFSGDVSYTGSNFSWLFSPSGSDLPQRGTLTLDPDTGNAISNSALAYDVTLRPSLRDGGEIRADCVFRFDG